MNHACDQDRQLSRYIEQNAGYDVYVLYLVRNQMDEGPSDKSLSHAEKNKMEKNGHFRKVSYQEHILKWLHLCLRKFLQKKPSLLGSALIQYSNYLDVSLRNKVMMKEKDAKAFEAELLGVDSQLKDPYVLNNKVKKLEGEVCELNRMISEYRKFLENRYLKYFKKITGLAKVRRNSLRQIEFAVPILGSDVLFIYDFLKTPPASYVWFGTQCEHFSGHNFEDKDKILARLKDIPSKYRIDDKDNADICAESDFLPFYSTEEWKLCKYCKDNNSAIDDIIMYLGWMSKGKVGDIG